MTALYIILGIIAFFVIVLAVKVRVTVHYDDDVALDIGWLFLKFKVLPKKDKPDKPKKKKKEKKKKEKPKEDESENKDETVKEPKQKKDNMFIRFYHNRGVEGVLELLKEVELALKGMFRRIFQAFGIKELYISMTVGAGDSAETAIKYGKTCEVAFPAMGYIVSNMRVGKYNIEITPDFIYGSNSARIHTQITVVPLRLINAVIIVAFQLLFKVVLKLLKHSKVKTKVEKQNNK